MSADELRQKLLELGKRRVEVRQSSDELQRRLRKLSAMKDVWLERMNVLESELGVVREELRSTLVEKSRCTQTLETMMQINVLNDCFYIWHMGPFATINGIKMGRLPNFYPVEWSDINAALGQAVLLLSTIVERQNGGERDDDRGFRGFSQYQLQPMGSFSKIVKKDDPSNKLNLYYDGSFSFFRERNFNSALQAFLKCVEEFGEFVNKQDPTLRLPYIIQDGKIGAPLQDGKVEYVSVALNSGSEEQWTRALKYLMSDLKWLVAWAAKHLHT